MMTDRHDRLFERASHILARQAVGFATPILWHLAMRGHGPAMLVIADCATQSGQLAELGRIQDALSPTGLMYRAYRRGVPHAAQNMALSLFNTGNLAGYRHWLRRAAGAGDADAALALNRFEIRRPHILARRWHRLRRRRPSD